MKKPGADESIIKKPSAESILKKPAAPPGKPVQPALESRFEKIVYTGCKIYWGGDRLYRVLSKAGAATKNFSWKTRKEAPKVWSDVVAFCEANER